MPRPITPEKIDKLIEEYARSSSVSIAAARVGISRPTAEKYLRQRGMISLRLLKRMQQYECLDCGGHNIGLRAAGTTDA